jgi:hypothetical protein
MEKRKSKLQSTYLRRIFLTGQANFFFLTLGLIPVLQDRQFLRCASPQIVNPQIFMINLNIANVQISTKYCTALPEKSPKSRLFRRFFYFVLI